MSYIHPFSPFSLDAFSHLKAAFWGVGRRCLYLVCLLASGPLYKIYVMGGKNIAIVLYCYHMSRVISWKSLFFSWLKSSHEILAPHESSCDDFGAKYCIWSSFSSAFRQAIYRLVVFRSSLLKKRTHISRNKLY